MLNIAILGYGVVGSGVYEIIRKNVESISKKADQEVDIKYIIDLRDFSDHKESELFIKDFHIALNDKYVDVVVEVIGGTKPAYEYTKSALLAGKHVVTSNKELVATHGTELLAIAKENHVNYLFEASVGGGIPIIRPIHQCLAANEITEVYGILNGTTNYILTKMIKEGTPFEEALKGAQKNGYAEANPSADVDGIDAGRKIAILASLVFGYEIDCNKIPIKGISDVTLDDVNYAEKLGYVIKLIGHTQKIGEKIFSEVAPMFVFHENPLACVEGVFNAIAVRGDSIGDVIFYGRGAGKLPTASAVVADIIDISNHIDKNKMGAWVKAECDLSIEKSLMHCKMFVKIKASDKANAIQIAKDTFGSIKIAESDSKGDEFGFLTSKMQMGEIEKKLHVFDEVVSLYQVIDED